MTAPTAGAARYTGTRTRRVEDPRLVQGRGTFVDDIVRPRMLHACFVRSPVAHAALGVIDVSAALALRGVRAVLTAADVNPQVHEQWYTSIGRSVPDTPRPPLADGRVRFVGDPVALVVAESRYIAEDAVDLVAVDYDQLPPVVDYVTAPASDVLVHDSYAANVAGSLGAELPDDLAAVFAGADRHVTATIFQQGYAPVPMETRGMVIEWSDDELTVWAATPSPHDVRMFLARPL